MYNEKHISKLLEFYNQYITEKEFMEYLNSDIELQKIFNHSLKSLLAPNETSIVDSMNKNFAKIGTPQEQFFQNNNKSINAWEIHFHVEQLLAKRYFSFLDKEDANKFILLEIENGWLYNADQKVEAFIKTKILKDLPSFNKSKDAIQYVKTKLNELFICENKKPRWIQCCEWPFDSKGNPMIFITQKSKGEKVEYEFLNNCTKQKETIIQYY